jgi:hypothetical protein
MMTTSDSALPMNRASLNLARYFSQARSTAYVTATLPIKRRVLIQRQLQHSSLSPGTRSKQVHYGALSSRLAKS